MSWGVCVGPDIVGRSFRWNLVPPYYGQPFRDCGFHVGLGAQVTPSPSRVGVRVRVRIGSRVDQEDLRSSGGRWACQ